MEITVTSNDKLINIFEQPSDIIEELLLEVMPLYDVIQFSEVIISQNEWFEKLKVLNTPELIVRKLGDYSLNKENDIIFIIGKNGVHTQFQNPVRAMVNNQLCQIGENMSVIVSNVLYKNILYETSQISEIYKSVILPLCPKDVNEIKIYDVINYKKFNLDSKFTPPSSYLSLLDNLSKSGELYEISNIVSNKFNAIYYNNFLMDIDKRGYLFIYTLARILGPDNKQVIDAMGDIAVLNAKTNIQKKLYQQSLIKQYELSCILHYSKILGVEKSEELKKYILQNPSLQLNPQKIYNKLNKAETQLVQNQIKSIEIKSSAQPCEHYAIVNNLRKTVNFREISTLASDVKNYIDPKEKLLENEQHNCKKCKQTLICPHALSLIELQNDNASPEKVKSAMDQYLMNGGPIQGALYCKICGESVYELNYDISETFSDQSNNDNELSRLIFGEISSLIRYLEIEKVLSKGKIIKFISLNIYPFINEIEKQLIKSRTNTSDETQNKIRFYIGVYTFAQFVQICNTNKNIKPWAFQSKGKKETNIAAEYLLYYTKLLMSVKNIIIKDIPNLTEDVVKQKIVAAYKLVSQKNTMSADYTKSTATVSESIEGIILDPAFQYIFRESKSKLTFNKRADYILYVDKLVKPPSKKNDKTNIYQDISLKGSVYFNEFAKMLRGENYDFSKLPELVKDTYLYFNTASGKTSRMAKQVTIPIGQIYALDTHIHKYVNGKCVICGKTRLENSTVNEEEIKNKLIQRDLIENYNKFYAVACPEGGSHDMVNNKCSKCNWTGKATLEYMAKYKIKVQPKPLPITAVVHKLPSIPKNKPNYDNFIKLAKICQVHPNQINCLSALNGTIPYSEVLNGKFQAPEPINVFDNRISTLSSNYLFIVAEYNKLRNIANLNVSQIKWQSLISREIYQDLSALPKKEIAMGNIINAMRVANNSVAGAIEIIKWILQTIVDFLLELAEQKKENKFNLACSDIAKYLLTDIIKFDINSSKPGLFSWSKLYGTKTPAETVENTENVEIIEVEQESDMPGLEDLDIEDNGDDDDAILT